MLLPGVMRAEGIDPLPAVVRVLEPEPPALDRLELVAGAWPRPGEAAVLLDRSAGRDLGLGPGDRVELEVGGRRLGFPVAGLTLSPDHLLTPCHPFYRIPLAGTFAVLALSPAAATAFEHVDLVDSLLFRFAPGSDAQALEERLVRELPVVLLEVVPRAAADAERTATQLLEMFDLYVPAALLVVVGVALTLLGLTMHRTISRQRIQIGVLLALGHRPRDVAASYLPLALLPATAGAVLGVALHGAYAAFVTRVYTSSLGFAPLEDPGIGAEAIWIGLACLGLAAAAAVLPALGAARERPLRLLHPAPTHRGEASGALRGLLRLRERLRLPLSVGIGFGYVWRRRWTSLFTVLSLGLTLALVTAFVYGGRWWCAISVISSSTW